MSHEKQQSRRDDGPSSRLVLEVPQTSNLDEVLRLFAGAIESIGAGLQAIGLALSTPHDNSQQVQEKINQYSNRVGSQTSALQNAVDKHEGD